MPVSAAFDIIWLTLDKVPEFSGVVLVFVNFILEIRLFHGNLDESHCFFPFLNAFSPISFCLAFLRSLSLAFIPFRISALNHFGWTLRFTSFCFKGRWSSIMLSSDHAAIRELFLKNEISPLLRGSQLINLLAVTWPEYCLLGWKFEKEIWTVVKWCDKKPSHFLRVTDQKYEESDDRIQMSYL